MAEYRWPIRRRFIVRLKKYWKEELEAGTDIKVPKR
jgi:hypothetical protein